MPSKKSNRASEGKRERNAPLRTKAKTLVSQTRKLIESGEAQDAEKSLIAATVALDKAAQKGVIHKRNASRRKSRLSKLLNGSLDPS